MPKPPDEKPESIEPEHVTVEEILARQPKLNTVDAAPPIPKKEANPPAHPPQGAAFMASDGRMMYRYQDGDDTIVTPKSIEEMTEEDFYRLPVTMFDGQMGRLPQTLTVDFVEPQYAGYWANCKAGDGARVGIMQALGFVPAKKEDLRYSPPGTNDADGAVRQHDLVLMKIHKAKLYERYRSWMQLAKMKGSIRDRNGVPDPSHAFNPYYQSHAEAQLPTGQTKASYYVTPQAQNDLQGFGPGVGVRQRQRS